MTRKEKVRTLEWYCDMCGKCDNCELKNLYDEEVDVFTDNYGCAFGYMGDKMLDKCYNWLKEINPAARFLKGFRKKAALHKHFIKKDDAIMKGRKRRLNPIYWTFQFLGGLVAIGSLFFIPAIVCKILGGC